MSGRVLAPSLLVALALGSACAPTSRVLEAEVTMTDGSSFHLAAPVTVADLGDSCALEARDDSRRFALTFFWPKTLVNDDHARALDGAPGTMRLVVTRPHPTLAEKVRFTSATDGVAFATPLAPCDLAGTFDAVRVDLDDPADTAHIAVRAGVFPGPR